MDQEDQPLAATAIAKLELVFSYLPRNTPIVSRPCISNANCCRNKAHPAISLLVREFNLVFEKIRDRQTKQGPMDEEAFDMFMAMVHMTARKTSIDIALKCINLVPDMCAGLGKNSDSMNSQLLITKLYLLTAMEQDASTAVDSVNVLLEDIPDSTDLSQAPFKSSQVMFA